MRIVLKAIGHAVLTELGLVGASMLLFEIGGFGPCGPASIVGALGEYIQYPGYWLMGVLWDSSIAAALAAVLTTQILLWTGLWFAWLHLGPDLLSHARPAARRRIFP
jgi:hypothetical protein